MLNFLLCLMDLLEYVGRGLVDFVAMAAGSG
jgi:hypothetical protein